MRSLRSLLCDHHGWTGVKNKPLQTLEQPLPCFCESERGINNHQQFWGAVLRILGWLLLSNFTVNTERYIHLLGFKSTTWENNQAWVPLQDSVHPLWSWKPIVLETNCPQAPVHLRCHLHKVSFTEFQKQTSGQKTKKGWWMVDGQWQVSEDFHKMPGLGCQRRKWPSSRFSVKVPKACFCRLGWEASALQQGATEPEPATHLRSQTFSRLSVPLEARIVSLCGDHCTCGYVHENQRWNVPGSEFKKPAKETLWSCKL